MARAVGLVIGVSIAGLMLGALVAAGWVWNHRMHPVQQNDGHAEVAQMAASLPVASEGRSFLEKPATPWHQGVDGVVVLTPSMGQDELQAAVDSVFAEMEQGGQFSDKRRAILLMPGDYGNLKIPVSWYTTVSGVGLNPSDVQIGGISSVDAYPGSKRGSLENFWKAVEGLSLNEDSTLWSISQGASMRRCIVQGDLWLSETDEQQGEDGANHHYASGGFLADVEVNGEVHWGMQQQFFFRSSTFADVDYTVNGQSFVFVGVQGAPDLITNQHKPLISNEAWAPRVAEKPYLVVNGDKWYIVVPQISRSQGAASEEDRQQARFISMDDVFVARSWNDAAAIQAGIVGKQALLLTPGIYGLAAAIQISQPGFVVLGIGMPTLVATASNSAIAVLASGVRVAQVVLESGSSLGKTTDPLLDWSGSDGVASDLFTRVGAFGYQTSFHRSCAVTRSDVMVQVDGSNVVLDNLWLWHADHDDCTAEGASPMSDGCSTDVGLVVDGNGVIAYGLAVEHTKGDLVQWNGDDGEVFFFQAELPYRSNLQYGDDGHVGYRVADDVQSHHCVGVGVYQVYKTFTMTTGIRLPATATATNLFSWCITDDRSGMGSLYCIGSSSSCEEGHCDDRFCYAPSVQ
jgi:hypothetical protein